MTWWICSSGTSWQLTLLNYAHLQSFTWRRMCIRSHTHKHTHTRVRPSKQDTFLSSEQHPQLRETPGPLQTTGWETLKTPLPIEETTGRRKEKKRGTARKPATGRRTMRRPTQEVPHKVSPSEPELRRACFSLAPVTSGNNAIHLMAYHIRFSLS